MAWISIIRASGIPHRYPLSTMARQDGNFNVI
jgi:hypothetical protein